MNEDEIDDFLEKVNRINQEIKGLADGTLSLDEIDVREKKELEKRKLEEKIQELKEREKKESIEKGTPGKGNGPNYIRFCKHCFVEYSIEKLNCHHCSKETITREERMNELKSKVVDYKKKKSDRETRKKKWENWRKTEAIFWKKTSTNYSKWDYFTSSSEEEDENAEPILPKNDPNFLALEKDFEERSKRRKEDRKAALKLKEDGNEYMKKRDYIKAIEFYSLAIDKVKDMKELYTNRALAYLKIGNYDKTIEDCSKILEYAEVFEEGYKVSPEPCFKALIRRAQAYKELKKIQEGLNDLETALKIFPEDPDGLRMQKEFQILMDHVKKLEIVKSEEQKNLNNQTQTNKKSDYVQQIDEFAKIENPKNEEIVKIIEILKSQPGLKAYAYEIGIIKKITYILNSGNYEKKLYLLIIVMLQDNSLYLDEFFKCAGPQILIKHIKAIALKLAEKEVDKESVFEDIEEVYEVFVNFTEQEKGRVWLKNAVYLENLIDELYSFIVKHLRTYKESANSFFSLISNLTVISDNFRIYIEKNYLKSFINDVMSVIYRRIKSNKYNRLRESMFGLLANLAHLESTRKRLIDESEESNLVFKYSIECLDNYTLTDHENYKWIRSVESILAFFINLSLNVPEEVKKAVFCEKYKIHDKITRFLALDSKVEFYNQVHTRLIQFSCKVPVTEKFIKESSIFLKSLINFHFSSQSKENGLSSNIIRLYLRIFTKENTYIKSVYSTNDAKKIANELSKVISEDNDERFVNGATLAGNIIEIYEEIATSFDQNIQKLIDICKNKTGILRKNAAIFLAKLSRNESNMEKIKSLHGIEILYNISQFVLN